MYCFSTVFSQDVSSPHQGCFKCGERATRSLGKEVAVAALHNMFWADIKVCLRGKTIKWYAFVIDMLFFDVLLV